MFEASPTAGDGKIYVMDHRGVVFVVSAAPDKFQIIGAVPMGDEADNRLRASIPLSDGQAFIRTGQKLYCIGGRGGAEG